MSGKSYLIVAAVVILLSTGCTRQIYHEGGSPLDKNWGRPYEEQKFSQIIDHEAGKNLDHVVGLDGKAAVNTVERYQKSFKRTPKGGGIKGNFNTIINTGGQP